MTAADHANTADLCNSLRTVMIQGERAMTELVWTHANVNWRDTLDALQHQAETAEALKESEAEWQRRGDRAIAAEAERDAAVQAAEQARNALQQIQELCDHWELHDKTDPDEHERWRLAAIRRAEMIGDHARAALAGNQP